jgi:hypothetical protein
MSVTVIAVAMATDSGSRQGGGVIADRIGQVEG